MKIALIGYGKMGKTIERIALERGHEVILRIDISNPEDFSRLSEADVAIEFSSPKSAISNLQRCFEAGIPVVCGTTGWLDSFSIVKKACTEKNGGFFYASNYSIGVNIFFAVNRQLATMMNGYPMYDVAMEEIHHTQKLDAPSGTAISLAEGIFENLDRKKQWICQEENAEEVLEITDNAILITAKRIDPTPGTHTITYKSPIDTIEISHTAHSREGFATGAVLAAEWLRGKKGVFSMRDMLGF